MDEARVAGWHGREVYDRDGAKIGKIEDAFLDERTGKPAWATVSAGLFGRRHHFVPLIGAREVDDGIAVPVDGRLVGDAPNVDRDGDLSVEDEHRLYEHYGIDDGIGAGAAGPGGTHDRSRHDRDDRHDHVADDHDRTHDAHGTHDRDPHPTHDAHDRDRAHDERADGDRDGARGVTDHDGSAEDRTGHGHGIVARAAAAVTPGRSHDRDDDGATGTTPVASGGDDDLRAQQAAAATAAAERAEREQRAADLAERDRLATSGAPTAAGAHREGPQDPQDVLPQTDATGDLDPAPSDHLTGATDHGTPVPDARFAGRPHVDDDHHVVPDRIIDPTGGGDRSGTTGGGTPGTASDGRADAGPAFGDHRPGPDPTATDRRPDAGTTDPATARPGVATRLRRLARSITPTKDDHHG